jgi:hypothetical protein
MMEGRAGGDWGLGTGRPSEFCINIAEAFLLLCRVPKL